MPRWPNGLSPPGLPEIRSKIATAGGPASDRANQDSERACLDEGARVARGDPVNKGENESAMSRRSSVTVPWDTVREITGAAGDVVEFAFRGDYVRGIACLNGAEVDARKAGPYPRPIIDLTNFDLVLNTQPGPEGWIEPAELQVAVVPRQVPLAAINHASQWASWCTRVAVVPCGVTLNEKVAFAAQTRGVWVVTSGGVVLVNGHHGCWPSSGRGFLHSLLAEALWQQLDQTAR